MKLPGTVRILLFTASFSLFANKITAQLSADDSSFYQKAVNNAVTLYYRSLGDQSGLYNGSQYAGYLFTFKEGHPFFYTDISSSGSIVYDNVFYPDVHLLYDEVAEVIIFQDTTHRIQLLTDRISRFSILGNNFIRLVKDSLSHSIVNTGFYNLLYEGNVSVLKKEVKTLHEDIRSNSEGLLRYIETKQYYYFKKNNEYYPVNGKNDVLDIYKDRKKEIQQYIKSNKLNFRNDRDNALTKVTAYYDQLTK